MTKCTCIDCMYGGNVGIEHGGTNLPSSEKGDNEMSEVNPRDFGVFSGLLYLDKEPPVRTVFGWVDNRIVEPTHYTAYVVKTDAKEYYVTTKEKALQIVSEMLDCEGKVEIKRIELS